MSKENNSSAQWIRNALRDYEAPLVRCAFRITGNKELAQDVVQDTFIRLCKADRHKVEVRLSAWLFTVCRNRALDIAKKEGRTGQLFDPQSLLDEDESKKPSEKAQQNETYEQIFTTVSSLPAEQQEAFMLKFQDDLSYREISRVMNKSVGTISKLIANALEAIRKQLQETEKQLEGGTA